MMRKPYVDQYIKINLKRMDLEKQIELLANGLTNLTAIVAQHQEIITQKPSAVDDKDGGHQELKDDEVSPEMKEMIQKREAEAKARAQESHYRGY